MYKVKNLKIILFYILLRGLYAPSFPDRGMWWKVLQVHGQGGHGLHEDPPDGAAHQHAGMTEVLKHQHNLSCC